MSANPVAADGGTAIKMRNTLAKYSKRHVKYHKKSVQYRDTTAAYRDTLTQYHDTAAQYQDTEIFWRVLVTLFSMIYTEKPAKMGFYHGWTRILAINTPAPAPPPPAHP
jgi:hypothetical protein